MRRISTYSEFRDQDPINEEIFGALWGWATGLLKQGKIKSALEKYEKELPLKTKERYLAELELTLATQAKGDVKAAESNLENIKEEEQLIKDELKLAIDEVLEKRPDLKLKCDRLKLETQKKLLPALRKSLEEIQKDPKYAKVKDDVIKKIGFLKQQDAEFTKKVSMMDNQDKSPEAGDVYYYKTKDVKSDKEIDLNVVLIISVESDGTGKPKIGGVKALTIKEAGKEIVDLKILVEKKKKKDFMTPIVESLKKKVTEEKDLSVIFGDLKKYNQYKLDLIPKPVIKKEDKKEENN